MELAAHPYRRNPSRFVVIGFYEHKLLLGRIASGPPSIVRLITALSRICASIGEENS